MSSNEQHNSYRSESIFSDNENSFQNSPNYVIEQPEYCTVNTPNIFVSKELSKFYESLDPDKSNLKTLLESWNLGDLVDFFWDQQLFVEVLKHLTSEDAKNILRNTQLSLGVQIEFFFHWKNWTKVCNQNGNSNQNVNRPTKACLFNQQALSLNTILNSNPYGLTVLKTFKEHKQLDPHSRKLLCEAIIHFCIDTNHSLTVAETEQLSRQIVDVFPNEEKAYYYVSRPNAAPLGKLYQKYRNWRNSLNRKLKSNQNLNKQLNFDNTAKPRTAQSGRFTMTQDEGYHLRVLKHEGQNLPFEEKMKHWKGCVAIRINSIKKLDKPILAEWPLYKQPDGYRLIESDFTYLYGEKNNFLDSMDSFLKIMIDKIFPEASSRLSTNEKEILQLLSRNEDNFDKNSICAMVFRLIQSILPSSRYSRKIKAQKENKRIFSYKDSCDAFITVCPTEITYRENYDLKVSNESAIAPYITLIGSLNRIETIMCDFDNITYKFYSLPKAIDACFKAFHLFNIEYPPACAPMWQFINNAFFHIKSKETVNPSIAMLIKAITEARQAFESENSSQKA